MKNSVPYCLMRICIILLTFVIALECNAVVAYPGWINFQQPNGVMVKIRLHGNEFVKWAESEDGYTLLHDNLGNLVYADLDVNGDLVSTNMQAVNINERPEYMRKRLQMINKRLVFSSRQVNMIKQLIQTRKRTSERVQSIKKPVIGKKKMLLILVEFADYKFQHTRENFEMLLNQLNYTNAYLYGSVRDFYLENSFGQLDIITDVTDIYKLSSNRAFYGSNNGLGQDLRPDKMALEAVSMADEDVDYTKYDNDGDGIVDGVHIIYAGPGEEAGGGSDCIWAHSWNIYAKLDGVQINKYSCSPEIRGSRGSNITNIGVICHELGHVLGCNDFYDTDYYTNGLYEGTGNWDLMASGNWNNDGACPAHFNPYIKIYDFGWAEPQIFNEATYVELHAKSKTGFVRINTQTEGEYFLLEYRSRSGFDSYIPGHGLMVYRASEGLSRYSDNTINARHRQQFYPLCANSKFKIPNEDPDSYGNTNSASTPFPGILNVKELTDFTTPSMTNWNGALTDLSITEIEENENEGFVTFNFAGCTDVYNFQVIETTESTVSLSWKMKKDVVVMLVVNNEPVFGVPESRLFGIGEKIEGGGSVVYTGNDLEFTDKGLNERQIYYYKLFCYDKIANKWISVNIREARTIVGTMHTRLYHEDFSSGNLSSNWKQEHVIAGTDWKVAQLFDNGDNMLIFNSYDNCEETKQRTRIIMPRFDFSGMKCAILSFKYLNKLRNMRVDYRLSSNDKWINLVNIESSYEYGVPFTENILNDTSTINIKLPQLTSTYEISFVADYIRRNSSYGEYEIAVIDNLEIMADYDVFIQTERPNIISNRSAEINCKVYNGILNYSECGIQWSIDSKTWINVPANEDGVVLLKDLPINTRIYYRGYVILPLDKKVFGEIDTFTTLNFEDGKGTFDDPFVINNKRDWDMLGSAIENGNDCSGLFFVLGDSFTIDYCRTINGTFNGFLNGKNFTLTIGHTLDILFLSLGEKSIVTNLNIKADNIRTSEFKERISTICYYNYGTISKCSVQLKNLVLDKESTALGGLCYINYGSVLSCKSEIYAKTVRLRCGGICNINYNIIANCSFYGNLAANNNYSLGGIAEINSYISRGSYDMYGKISNCVNYAQMEAYEMNGDSQSGQIGGICVNNKAIVDCCINQGNINLFVGDNLAGGICASMGGSSKVTNCYNVGNISAKRTEKNSSDVFIGGIAASILGYDIHISSCFSSCEIYTEQYVNSYVHEIVGMCRSLYTIRNCFYTGDFIDKNGEKCTIEELASHELVDKLNKYSNQKNWIASDKHPKLQYEQTKTTLLFGGSFSSNDSEVAIPWLCTGSDVIECGIQWRQEGTDDLWNVIKGEANKVQKTEITGLSASFPIEVKLYAITLDNNVFYSGVERVATQFLSTGDKNDPHLINDYSDLLAFSSLVWNGRYFSGETIKLTCDIDLKGDKGILWNPIRSRYDDGVFDGEFNGFSGEFDGGGHIISHMHVVTNDGYAGLFANSDGYIHDFTVVESSVVSNALPNEHNGLTGVGGIVGGGLKNKLYPHVVEKCGFVGTITGGNPIGGIIGAGFMEAVKSCYVIGSINNTDTTCESIKYDGEIIANGRFIGGIIGIGSADGCYFKGNINNVTDKTDHISCGPISGEYIGTEEMGNQRCFYNVDSEYDFSNKNDDVMLDLQVMCSDLFFNYLSDTIWVRADYVNNGFPIIATCGNSKITTCEAFNNDTGDIVLSGIFTQGVDRIYSVCGFKWYITNSEEILINDIVSTDEFCPYTCVLPNESLGDANINYIAYAAQNNDTLWGEWKSFTSQIIVPKISVMSVISYERDLSEVCYSVNKGTFVVDECVLTYYSKENPSSVHQCNIDASLSRFIIDKIQDNTWYECFITIKTSSGHTYISNKYEWFHQSKSDTYKITYILDGTVFAVVELKRGEEIIPIEMSEMEGYVFSGWDIPYKYMPAKDIIVYGTYTPTSIGMPLEKDRIVNVYTIDGKRIRTQIPFSKAGIGLPKGVYIIDGHKILIK